MTLLSPSRHTRLNEAAGLLLLLLGLAVSLSLVSYSPGDPSWDTATAATHTHNLLGLFARSYFFRFSLGADRTKGERDGDYR